MKVRDDHLGDRLVFMLGSSLTGTCETELLDWWTFDVSAHSGFNIEFQNRG